MEREAGKVRQKNRLEVGMGKCEQESKRETAENRSRERLQGEGEILFLGMLLLLWESDSNYAVCVGKWK